MGEVKIYGNGIKALMSRNKRLFKNTLIYAIGNFGAKLIGFIFLPIYTGYLSTGEFGYFDLITTIINLAIPIVSFQIMDGLYRYLLESKSEEDKKIIISNSFSVVLKNILVLSMVYLLSTFFWKIDYGILILLNIILAVIQGLISQIVRGLQENNVYAISGIIYSAAYCFIVLILVVSLGFGIEGLILSNIFSSCVSMVYMAKKVNLYSLISLNKTNKMLTNELIKYSIPLIPNLVNWWIINMSDRLILTYYEGIDANGLYAISNKFPSILIIVNTIFNLAWQENAILEYKSKDRDEYYTKVFNHLVTFQFLSLFILISVTRPFFNLLINSKFESAGEYIPFLYLAVIFSAFSSFYGTGFQSSKETKGAFSSSVFSAAINIILNFLLIPIIGIQGASISTGCSFFMIWILRIFQTKKYFIIKIDWLKLLILTIITAVYIYFYFLNIPILNISMLIFSIILFLAHYYKLIVYNISNMKKKLGSNGGDQ